MTGIDVDIVIEDPAWNVLDLQQISECAARVSLRHLGLGESAEIALLATDDAGIRKLNAGFRDKDVATNVLSWPAQDLTPEAPGGQPALPEADFPGEPLFLGDIALAWQTCVREAESAEKPLVDHIVHLFVHGLLHLLGYDHICDEDALLMERLEVEILGSLGMPSPY